MSLKANAEALLSQQGPTRHKMQLGAESMSAHSVRMNDFWISGTGTYLGTGNLGRCTLGETFPAVLQDGGLGQTARL